MGLCGSCKNKNTDDNNKNIAQRAFMQKKKPLSLDYNDTSMQTVPLTSDIKLIQVDRYALHAIDEDDPDIIPLLVRDVPIQLIDMDPQYWRERIMDWIQDAKDNNDTPSEQDLVRTRSVISFSKTEWRNFEAFITSLWHQIKRDNGFKQDWWSVIQTHIRNERRENMSISPPQRLCIDKSKAFHKALSIPLIALTPTPGPTEHKKDASVSRHQRKNEPLEYEDYVPTTNNTKSGKALRMQRECENENCCKDSNTNMEILDKCPCLKRIRTVLNVYNQSLSAQDDVS
eukprot:587451_1